jgi:hypothetical protein
MLRELRSCVTLLREMRIVNQSYAQWPSDSNGVPDKTSRNANIALDLHVLLKHYVQYESLEERTAASGCSGPRGGQ